MTQRVFLPAVPSPATPQQQAAGDGAGALDELAHWEFWLRHKGATALADDVAAARMHLYLRACDVIEGRASAAAATGAEK